MAAKSEQTSLLNLNQHWPWLVLLLWPFLILAQGFIHPETIFMLPGAQFSDLLISHWPNAEVIRQSLFEYHQFPLWNPSILGGAPLAADPLAGLWYPPNWLTWVLPLPFAFTLLLALHLAWGGWGLYGWARANGFSKVAALVGALTFAALPKLIAHLAAGHVSLVFAVSWTPWLLWFAQRAIPRESGLPLRLGPMALVGLVWAITFLADVRWGVMAGLVLLVWWLVNNPNPWLQRAYSLSIVVAIFLLIAAVLWLPLFQFVQLSSRVELTPQEAATFSLQPGHLVGMLFPNLNGSQEYVTYLGLIPLVLALIGIRFSLSKDRVGTWTMLGFGVGALWWAFGPNLGLFWVVSRLPGLSLLRVPTRAWFVVGLVVSWLAVRGVALVETGWRPTGRVWNLASLALVWGAWILAIGGSLLTKKPLFNLMVTAFAFTGLWFSFRFPQTLSVLLIATAAELWFTDALFFQVQPVATNAVADWLGEQPGQWRVYSPSYSLPQLAAAQHHLQQADGVNPLQLAETVTYMERASGVKRKGYSVTIPSFDSDTSQSASADLSTINKDAIPDAHLLGALNVRYVASEFDLAVDGLTLQTTRGNTRIYLNAYDQGRVQGGTLLSWSPNRIEIAATGPGQVTLSEVSYPGWVATLDGVQVPVEQSGIFRAVTVGTGAHTIVFQFQPLLVWFGLGLTILGLIVVFLAIRFRPCVA